MSDSKARGRQHYSLISCCLAEYRQEKDYGRCGSCSRDEQGPTCGLQCIIVQVAQRSPSKGDKTETPLRLRYDPKIGRNTWIVHQAYLYACCACPCLSASKALTSVTYCRPSNSGIRCRSSWSVGSLIQPSMGIALSVETIVSKRSGISRVVLPMRTFVENV